MLFEIIFCFFTVFGIVQLVTLLWELFYACRLKNCAVVVKINDETDVKQISDEIRRQKGKVVFVYDGISKTKLEILSKNFEFASFVTSENLAGELLKLM